MIDISMGFLPVKFQILNFRDDQPVASNLGNTVCTRYGGFAGH
jgi:hypothetical protein